MHVSGIAVDYDILSFGYPSSEGSPIGSGTVSRPRTGDGVDAFAEGEEGDGKTVDEDGAEDDERDDGLNGLCKELGLRLRVGSFRSAWQLLNGQG